MFIKKYRYWYANLLRTHFLTLSTTKMRNFIGKVFFPGCLCNVDHVVVTQKYYRWDTQYNSNTDSWCNVYYNSNTDTWCNVFYNYQKYYRRDTQYSSNANLYVMFFFTTTKNTTDEIHSTVLIQIHGVIFFNHHIIKWPPII